MVVPAYLALVVGTNRYWKSVDMLYRYRFYILTLIFMENVTLAVLLRLNKRYPNIAIPQLIIKVN